MAGIKQIVLTTLILFPNNLCLGYVLAIYLKIYIYKRQMIWYNYWIICSNYKDTIASVDIYYKLLRIMWNDAVLLCIPAMLLTSWVKIGSLKIVFSKSNLVRFLLNWRIFRTRGKVVRLLSSRDLLYWFLKTFKGVAYKSDHFSDRRVLLH